MTPVPRVGWLFAYDWDRLALEAIERDAGLARFDHAGFDLFSFPSNAALVGFDLERFAERQAARGRRMGWQGVLSHHEQFGALAAALVAERLGLPGATPESVMAAQHKLHARQVLQKVAPEANVASRELPTQYGEPIPEGLPYPSFVKPVKAAFSVLARRVDSRAELQAHTRFGRRELWVIRRLVEPFERVCRARLPQAGSAHRMLLEEPAPAHASQYNLDGWVQDGQVHALGVVDAIMYPGTQAFMRWEHPSRASDAVQKRALDVARRFLGAIGYRHGFFNLEFFHDAASDRLTVIECNPRLASQFADLYRRVQGVDAHAMAVALARGEAPELVPRCEPTAGVAASLVYRTFDPLLASPPQPDAAARSRFAAQHPQGLLFGFPKQGHSLARDFKWTGSHRYAIVHLGAADRDELHHQAERASALFGWPAPYFDHPGEHAPAAAPAADWRNRFTPPLGAS
ncbi:ATP-grasp domain-containing protein [Rhizobacter sp. AJA081-3]|uniref:ATP-grasp domain-containing protein n=1 Tax=Rhizobacter sp. AJA081-3 TaxID=2753607 RepID=UPI001ADFA8B7|nr:ATP-grasp domain-containing protein [Rhizobacter sp. AJA081-3]QTN25488.1 ATP-grasp domain-containing protein [Rhizobacter sp. AJA081-3]